MQIKHSIMVALVGITSAFGSFNALALDTFEFDVPEIPPSAIMRMKSSTDFSSMERMKRSSGKNIFLKVAPSVVKILTKDSSGSGVIISNADNGYVLTNHHVIEGYKTVGIIFANDSDKDEVSIGTVIKYDEIKDLALVRLNQKRADATPITVAEEKINIGDDVHAIGHPVGEDWTYTRGYVSQLRDQYSWQTDVSSHHVANVIQTQTPINPGNSGGPLVNQNGEMVGINTFKNSKYAGLNYSVANSSVQEFLNSKQSNTRKAMNNSKMGKLLNTRDNNKNGTPDVYFHDRNSNNAIDLIAIDADENQRAERILFDKNENKIVELAIFEHTFEGRKVIVYEFDENEDEKIENIGIDFDMDGKIDKMLPKS